MLPPLRRTTAFHVKFVLVAALSLSGATQPALGEALSSEFEDCEKGEEESVVASQQAQRRRKRSASTHRTQRRRASQEPQARPTPSPDLRGLPRGHRLPNGLLAPLLS